MSDPTESNEIASLRAENASLRASLAELEREFKAHLAQCAVPKYEDAHPSETHDHSNDGEETGPTFPPEVFMMIASYLKPGSQTLKRLMSTCRNLYALLLPRLLYKIDSDAILHPSFAHYQVNLPHFLASHVKEIELYVVWTDTVFGRERTSPFAPAAQSILKTCCAELTRFKLTMEENSVVDMEEIRIFGKLCRTLRFPKVETFELERVPAMLPGWFSLGFPNIRKLVFALDVEIENGFCDATAWSCYYIFQYLEQVNLTLPHPHNELIRFPGFLSKIKEYRVTCNHCLLELLKTPQFQPTTLVSSRGLWADPAGQELGIWQLLSQKEGVKEIKIDYQKGGQHDEEFLVQPIYRYGFPKNLEVLECNFLVLSGIDPQDIRGMRDKVPASLKRTKLQFVVDECPSPATSTWDSLLEELLFWGSLPKRGGRSGPETEPLEFLPYYDSDKALAEQLRNEFMALRKGRSKLMLEGKT